MAVNAHDAEVKRIRRIFRQWRERLFLHDWEVRLDYVDGEFVSPDGAASGEANATCAADWKYRHALITFNTRKTRDLSDETLTKTIIHEAMHVHLNEMRHFDTGGLPHEERVASTLAQAFLWTFRDGGLKVKAG